MDHHHQEWEDLRECKDLLQGWEDHHQLGRLRVMVDHHLDMVDRDTAVLRRDTLDHPDTADHHLDMVPLLRGILACHPDMGDRLQGMAVLLLDMGDHPLDILEAHHLDILVHRHRMLIQLSFPHHRSRLQHLYR